MSSSTKKYWDIDQPIPPLRKSAAGSGIQILVQGTQFDLALDDPDGTVFITQLNSSPAFDSTNVVWS